jgi:hypothetical protein
MPVLAITALESLMVEVMQQMVAWLVYRAVLSAPVAERPVQAITALESPTLGIRMAASAETIDGLSLAGRKSAVRVVGGAVRRAWAGGRGKIHCSLRSPAGVLPCFFLGFFTGGGADSGDWIGVAGCGVETTEGTAIGGGAGVACAGATGTTVAAPPRPRRRR